MISSVNVITLPRTCFAVVLDEYEKYCDETTLKLNKLVYKTKDYPDLIGKEITNSEESIVTNNKETLYVNLDVRKYLKTDAKLLSGKVQALNCKYYIHTYQDTEDFYLQSVKDILSKSYNDEYLNKAKRMLEDALDFDLISESDFVQMTYKNSWRNNWKENSRMWNIADNQDTNKVIDCMGMLVPADKIVLELANVLKYSKNRKLTEEDTNKIKRLLAVKDSEKVALTLLNTINPELSFVELLCLINHMEQNISKRNSNVPTLPLLRGAYDISIRWTNKADEIVEMYQKHKGFANDEILERIADNYYHPQLETSTVFDFKLKRKRK